MEPINTMTFNETSFKQLLSMVADLVADRNRMASEIASLKDAQHAQTLALLTLTNSDTTRVRAIEEIRDSLNEQEGAITGCNYSISNLSDCLIALEQNHSYLTGAAADTQRSVMTLLTNALDASTKAKMPTPEAKKPIPEAKMPTPDAKKPIPEAKMPTPEAKMPTPEAKMPTPEAKKPTPEAKKPTPEAKMLYAAKAAKAEKKAKAEKASKAAKYAAQAQARAAQDSAQSQDAAHALDVKKAQDDAHALQKSLDMKHAQCEQEQYEADQKMAQELYDQDRRAAQDQSLAHERDAWDEQCRKKKIRSDSPKPESSDDTTRNNEIEKTYFNHLIETHQTRWLPSEAMLFALYDGITIKELKSYAESKNTSFYGTPRAKCSWGNNCRNTECKRDHMSQKDVDLFTSVGFSLYTEKTPRNDAPRNYTPKTRVNLN